ncbi:MAG: Asp-tRNA(Asn)/Glu-tRNA(Gln) amidotransferase subunit GatB [Candidatus Sungbacteria bacterium]|nr:Asp-tRNA(Asn)/Glu-tRNA(Gln) amidotransferase subunit GatB [Candidatus Sungbacteria bacterium]
MAVKYESVIGLEIHAELNTKTKMFCQCLNDPNERHPNINICPICMGHPGTLPVINRDAVEKVIMTGLALHGEIPEFSQFDRKNYFYPDLPKGYQISQYKYPLVNGGYLEILISGSRTSDGSPTSEMKRIRITRIHLEEDAGRLSHDKSGGASLVDFNRAGVPLMELVTEPDFRTADEVKKFGEELQKIVRYIGASDADMEKGQMRIEVNISLREIADQRGNSLRESAMKISPRNSALELGTKVEIKNINSFKFAADAVEYETKRQSEILDGGGKIVQETRGWNESRNESFSQRSKEEAHDYRYFPEPDLPPLKISRDWVDKLQARIPELPAEKIGRFIKEFGIERDIAEILSREKTLADYYEAVISELKEYDEETPEKPVRNLEKLAASVMTGDFLRILRKQAATPSDLNINPENFAELTLYLAEDKISNLAAKRVLEEMVHSGNDPSDIINRLNLWQISDTADLENIARHIISENPKTVEDYRGGKMASVQFLIGQVMKESRGKANPKIVQEIIKKLLNSHN